MLTTNVMPQSLGYYLPRPSLVPITNMQPAAPRAASEKWNAQDDAQLMQARAQGLNWAPLQSRYFPTKTPNACRKRHERLMEKRNSEDWSPERVENLGKEYLNVRKEMWSILASRTGERWQDVEKKVRIPVPSLCYDGLENISSEEPQDFVYHTTTRYTKRNSINDPLTDGTSVWKRA